MAKEKKEEMKLVQFESRYPHQVIQYKQKISPNPVTGDPGSPQKLIKFVGYFYTPLNEEEQNFLDAYAEKNPDIKRCKTMVEKLNDSEAELKKRLEEIQKLKAEAVKLGETV